MEFEDLQLTMLKQRDSWADHQTAMEFFPAYRALEELPEPVFDTLEETVDQLTNQRSNG